jgi:acyl dehydratase
MTAAVTFEELTAGTVLGSRDMEVTARDLAAFDGLALPPHGPVPPGVAVALLMRGYMNILPHRPPGNIHASLRLEWGAPLALGDRLTLSLRCREKERRKGRPWVLFESVLAKADGTFVLAGVKWMVWAA